MSTVLLISLHVTLISSMDGIHNNCQSIGIAFNIDAKGFLDAMLLLCKK